MIIMMCNACHVNIVATYSKTLTLGLDVAALSQGQRIQVSAAYPHYRIRTLIFS